jgi:deaminated glutathione amidase
MIRPVTLAAVQMPSAASGTTNAEKQASLFAMAEDWLNRAGEKGADIACLGETFNILGLDLTPESVVLLARDGAERAAERFAPIAHRCGMAIIAPVLSAQDGQLRNLALVIDEGGRTVGRYSKVHCTEKERRMGIIPGDTWPTFAVAGARIGIQICHDNSFPESARCLTLNGAEIVFWPHTMSGWGGEFMDILLRSPAIHNGVHHVPVCFGCPPDRAWQPGMLIGRSSIIGPDATIIADAGRHPGIAVAEIDLGAPRIASCFTRDGDHVWQPDMLADRRPETYESLTRPSASKPPAPAAAPIPPRLSS